MRAADIMDNDALLIPLDKTRCGRCGMTFAIAERTHQDVEVVLCAERCGRRFWSAQPDGKATVRVGMTPADYAAFTEARRLPQLRQHSGDHVAESFERRHAERMGDR